MKIILRFGIAIFIIVIVVYRILVPFLTLADEFVGVELFAVVGLSSFAGFRCWSCARGERHAFILSSAFNTKELFANYELVLEEAQDPKDADNKEGSHQADDQRRIVSVIVLKFAIDCNLCCVLGVQLDAFKCVLVFSIYVYELILCIKEQLLSILHDHKFHTLRHFEN